MSTIFTKIIEGEIACYKIAEDADFFAFLDINPLTEGHTLVIPKTEVDYYFDIDDELMSKYSVFSKKIALGIKKVIPCVRVGAAVMGLEVPHAHVHLIPFNTMSDMNFSNEKLKLSPERFEELAQLISNEISL